ncbi:MAG: amphi-Trp domain-containing protein [Thermodesulfobacteriota bacterium]|nr:amphi-Trp domain-containing protein [Thermodesulfobacteriota bacterium]
MDAKKPMMETHGGEKNKKKEISMEKICTTSEAIAYLEEIAKCLKQDKLVVEQDNDYVALTPPSMETVKVEIEAKQKGSKEKIQITLSWQHFVELTVASNDLVISAIEPEDLKTSHETAAAGTQDKKKIARTKTPGKKKAEV